jgi:hypothetical protein
MSNDIDTFWHMTVFAGQSHTDISEEGTAFDLTCIQICLSKSGFQIVKCFSITIR